MKKFFVKVLAIVFSLLFSFSAFACNVELDIEEEVEIDPNRTQLYVGLFDGALGREMMDKIIAEYEAVNPDVQVIIRFLKNEFEDGTLLVQMPNSDVDMYYLSSNTYPSFVDKHLLEDLTDTISTKIFDDNGDLTNSNPTKSILDTMRPDWRNLFKAKDGCYYAIPNWMSTPGIIYDADLFEEMHYTVPETYNDLIKLMNNMKNAQITPFCFSTLDYITINSMAYFYADYEGRDDFFLNSTFSGTDSSLGEINLDNAWKLQEQEGRKAMLKFAYDLARNSAYTTNTTRSGLTHLAAQGEFVRSINNTQSNRVAMLLENSYWERETKNTFDQMGELFGEGYGWGERNFKYMLAPKFVNVSGINDSTNTKHTVYGATSNSWACINKNSTRKDLAKDFMQFAQSRRSLALYTIYSGCLRAYEFTMTPEEYNLCTPYTKSVYDLTQRDDVEFVCFSKQNDILKKQTTDFDYMWLTYTKAETDVGGGGNGTVSVEGRQLFNLFLSNPKLTVDSYFDGMSSYYQPRWSDYNK